MDNPLLSSWLRSLRAQNYAPATLSHYELVVRSFAECHDIETAKRGDVEAWMVSLGERMKPVSVHSYYRALKRFYSWLLEEEEIEAHPMARLRPPIVDAVRKDVVSEELMLATLRRLEKAKAWRDLAIVAVLYDTGMRVSELIALTREDVNLDAGVILIGEAKRRGRQGRKPRMVHVSSKGVDWLDRYLRRRKDALPWLFLGQKGRMTRSGVYQLVRRIFADSGLRIGPHDLRHTSASHTVGRVGDSEMMALFGWSSGKMLRHYSEQRLNSAAIESHRRASPLERL